MFQNGGKASISVRFLMEQSVTISSNNFWGTPFLEKGLGSPKISEGGQFDPHWLISRINLHFPGATSCVEHSKGYVTTISSRHFAGQKSQCPLTQLIGTLRSNDADGDENAKKQ